MKENTLPSHMPTLVESGLGTIEFDMIVSSEFGQLAEPAASTSEKRKK